MLAAALCLASLCAAPAAAFGFSSLPHEHKILVAPEIHYGNNLTGLGYWGIGSSVEFELGGVAGLYGGAGLRVAGLDWGPPAIAATSVVKPGMSLVDMSAYVRYRLIGGEQAKITLGIPLGLYAVCGFGADLELSRVGPSGFDWASAYPTPIRVLAALSASYSLRVGDYDAYLGLSVGFVDRGFGYYLDFHYPLSSTLSLNATIHPLLGIGIGASFGL